jgi:hypothetical protein
MRAHAIAVYIASFVLSTVAFPLGSARAQTAQPAVGSLETTPIGKVVSAKGSVTVEHTQAVVLQAAISPTGAAKVGDAVYRGDVVQTAADGAVGIAFTDGTAFNISSNARMVLNEFVYDPKGKQNSTLFSLSKGTFTFVAGQVAKTGDMKIDTPVATMGIRGTTPHVEISDDGSVSFATLIEEPTPDRPGRPERRGSNDQKGAPAAKQRQAKAATPPPPSPADRALQEADRRLNVKLNICRGC